MDLLLQYGGIPHSQRHSRAMGSDLRHYPQPHLEVSFLLEVLLLFVIPWSISPCARVSRTVMA